MACLVPLIVLLAIIDGWLFGRRRQPLADTTYANGSLSGRWSFPVAKRKATRDPILLKFRKAWGSPRGDDTRLAAGAWKARVTALHELAELGKSALPSLLAALDDEDEEIRELSAQALTFLGDRSIAERLDRAIYEDPDATVRIYAAIARANVAGPIPKLIADHITRRDPHPIVRYRFDLLRESDPASVAESTRAMFAAFDPSRMDIAKIGELAPDFVLSDLNGTPHRLSDYRGKKDVVLVFVYGATCMYCSGQLGHLLRKLPDFDARGAQILVIEANSPYRMRSTLRDSGTGADVGSLAFLSDSAHTVAATYGVAMQMNHIEWLNRPSTFLIDREGIIRKSYLAKTLADRPPVEVLLDALSAMNGG